MLYFFSHISVVSADGSRCCLHLDASDSKTSYTTKPSYNPRRHACNGLAPNRILCGVEFHCRSCVVSHHSHLYVMQPQIATDGLSIPLFSAWCNIRTLSLPRTLSSMTTSDWFFKNTTQNESNEGQMSFHVTVDFEFQSPKESGPKTATPPSTATPEVDVDFQEQKNQTELENVLSVTLVSAPVQTASPATTPTDNRDTAANSSTGPPGTRVPAFQVRSLASQ